MESEMLNKGFNLRVDASTWRHLEKKRGYKERRREGTYGIAAYIRDAIIEKLERDELEKKNRINEEQQDDLFSLS